jgi:rhodanese-related sulfurtransferase
MKSSTWWVLAVVVGSQGLMWGVGMAAERIANNGPLPAITRPEQAPRITVTQLAQLQKSKKPPLIIDLRSTAEYEAGHIANAICVPSEMTGQWSAKQPPYRKLHPVVLYCACSAEQSSGIGVLLLRNQGFINVVALKGGWAAWQEKKLPVHKGNRP